MDSFFFIIGSEPIKILQDGSSPAVPEQSDSGQKDHFFLWEPSILPIWIDRRHYGHIHEREEKRMDSY
ncbi:hypothetical protein NPIL_650761 [Nephila pilipes]|uniref:Uncharacterized protein n=1 Tax=Nephila pilipes TaxID=299642 RepID=A0A8X6Q8D0_NEPPI|nr:hypothetical protein NPIL_650761 [Nephila pilipes]